MPLTLSVGADSLVVMRIGAHVDQTDPLASARAIDAEIVQLVRPGDFGD